MRTGSQSAITAGIFLAKDATRINTRGTIAYAAAPIANSKSRLLPSHCRAPRPEAFGSYRDWVTSLSHLRAEEVELDDDDHDRYKEKDHHLGGRDVGSAVEESLVIDVVHRHIGGVKRTTLG
jgi:hypothetical protein